MHTSMMSIMANNLSQDRVVPRVFRLTLSEAFRKTMTFSNILTTHQSIAFEEGRDRSRAKSTNVPQPVY